MLCFSGHHFADLPGISEQFNKLRVAELLLLQRDSQAPYRYGALRLMAWILEDLVSWIACHLLGSFWKN